MVNVTVAFNIYCTLLRHNTLLLILALRILHFYGYSQELEALDNGKPVRNAYYGDCQGIINVLRYNNYSNIDEAFMRYKPMSNV